MHQYFYDVKRILTILLATTFLNLNAQEDFPRKSYEAFRTSESVNIDARDDESSWSLAPVASDFSQFSPVVDGFPSQPTEVKIMYDDQAIYVFAKLLDNQPDSILTQLTLRDQTGNSDWFGFGFDTYKDGQNAFLFFVTAAGVQIDLKASSDGEDENWDAVWESATRITDDGWYAEFMIPYSAIRFAEEPVQSWRMQFERHIRRYRENVNWNRRDPNIDNGVAMFGVLDNIRNIKSPPRISINPFAVGYVNSIKDPDANPIKERGTAYGLGMDLKYGLNDAFTLDMTLIPDFGQTQSDNVVLNLGPFEQFFEERRPFFTEGIELFNKGGLFYSRRVGDRTFRSAELQEGETFIENPSRTQLYNAFKISGRTAKGTGIGIFNAVEAKEFAVIQDDAGNTREELVNPLTNYNVVVVDQNLKNNSFVSFINTNTLRFGSEYDANVSGFETNLKTKDQMWGVSAFGALSNQFYSDSDDISGHAYRLNIGKIGGKLNYSLGYNIESDTYDINDLGILFSNNERSYRANISYNEFAPKKNFNRWRVAMNWFYGRLYQPNVYSQLEYEINSFFFTKKFLGFGFYTGGQPMDKHDYFEPRTFDFVSYSRNPAFQYAGGFISTDYRKTFAYDFRVTRGMSFKRGVRYLNLRFEPRWRVNDQLLIILGFDYEQLRNSVQYVNRNGYDEPIAEVSDQDILYGLRDRFTWTNSISANYVLSNTSSITLNLRHNHDEVEWHDLATLRSDGLLNPISFDGVVDNKPVFDQNANFLNMDLQYIKRFAPGSDIIFVWQKLIFGNDDRFERNYLANLSNLGEHFQTNSVSLRIVYFLDYQTFR